MRADRLTQVLRIDAVIDLGLGLLLLSGTWNGLYDALDLPKAEPALLAQIGGALLIAFAYLLWVAPAGTDTSRRVAEAAAIANGLGAAVILAWLVFTDLDDIRVGTLGTVELAIATAVLALLAFLQFRLSRAGPG